MITLEDEKRGLIRDLSDQSVSLALYYEDLEEEDLVDSPVEVAKIRKGLFVVSPPYEYEDLEKLWSYGNWNLIAPPRDDFKPVDTFRLRDSEVAEVLRSYELSILVDSFHDNIEWKVNERS